MDNAANTLSNGSQADDESSYDRKPRISKPPYGIVGCKKLNELPALVNIEIADGYEPMGSPFFYERDQAWCQAMYKRPALVTPTLVQSPPAKRR